MTIKYLEDAFKASCTEHGIKANFYGGDKYDNAALIKLQNELKNNALLFKQKVYLPPADFVAEEIDAEKILQDTLKISGILDVLIENKKISLITTHSFIRHKDHNYHIGQVKIDIHIAEAHVTIFNLTHPDLNKIGNAHPHVWENGRVCLGEINGDVPRLINHLMLPELAQVMLIFMRNMYYEGRLQFPKISDDEFLVILEQDNVNSNISIDDLKKAIKQAKTKTDTLKPVLEKPTITEK